MVHAPSLFSPITLPPPSHFDVREDNRASRWGLWREDFESYLAAVGDFDSNRKKAILFYCAGPALKRLFEGHSFSDSSYEQLLATIENRFCSANTVPFNRFKLSELAQGKGESTDDYASRLRLEARFCKLKCQACNASFTDEYLFDIILRNTSLPQLRTRVFERRLSKLDELLTSARNLEISVSQAARMNTNRVLPEPDTMSVANSSSSGTRPRNIDRRSGRGGASGGSQPSVIRCKFCGRSHVKLRSQCPAVNKECFKCGESGHFSTCCEQSNPSSACLDSSPTECDSAAQTIVSDSYAFQLQGRRQATVELTINGSVRKFLIDTGATDNLVPANFLSSDSNCEPSSEVRCYSGARIKTLGRVTIPVTLPKGTVLSASFLVVEHGQPLLGLRSCVDFGLVELDDCVNSVVPAPPGQCPELSSLVQEFPELFDSELAHVRDVKAHIQLTEEARPKFMRHRTVPLALREKVINSLDKMIQRGTLKPVKTSSWASPMVTVPKPDGTVRLCADYTATLSRVIDTEAYPLPHPDELFSSLAGKSVFTKLDLRTCFEQFELDEESKQYLTVNTIRGLLEYQRLPYGVSSAPAIVQRAMEEILRGLDVQVYLDDILVATVDMESHLLLLWKVFERLRRANIRLRLEKCIFGQSEVKYLGFIVTVNGRSPDPEKIKAIQLVPVPSSTTELRAFLGLVRFYDKFISNLSEIAHPLHQLLKKDVSWNWTDERHAAFVNIKKSICSSDCLRHYDPTQPIVLATDASPFGVSAVLSHRDSMGNEYPIASRSLSPAEIRYAQIDREALAIIYGVKKFSSFLLVRRFVIVTDHKPLQSIFGNKKGLPALTTARLHRYSLYLLSFSFEVEYRSGPKNGNADALSRAPVDFPTHDGDGTDEFLIASMDSFPLNREVLVTETAMDEILPRVLNYTRSGWPSNCPDHPELKYFWTRRQELSISTDILLWGNRVVVPDSMKASVLSELHYGHPGIMRMKAIARLYVWWPTLSTDIESFVELCVPCQMNAACPPAQFVRPWPAAEVWQRVHLDYEIFNGRPLLILVDAGSKWMEAKFMHSSTSTATLRTVYEWFCRFGYPVEVHTDGGPQFTSAEFKEKMVHWGISVTVSPPIHPSSNGAAEKAVRFVKDSLKKNVPLEQILFCHRATPLDDKSPADLMLGRPLRTRLSALKP